MKNSTLKISLLAAVVMLVVTKTTNAQQDPMFTHYMYNTLAVNPGYAGTRDALTITGLHRSQWVGFDGAPVTQTITMHTPFISNKFGVGLSILNDKIGPTNTTSGYLDLAYHLPINEKSKLSVGLKGGVNVLQSKLGSVSTTERGDNSFQNNVQSKLLPNIGAGLYYHRERFYIGASAPKLLENNFSTNTSTGSLSVLTEQRHFFAIAGALFNLTNGLKLKPTTLVKITKAAPIEVDLTGEFIIKDKLTLGLMGRSFDAIGALVGYQFTDQLRAGYSFDWSLTQIRNYNYGSHELMLMYDFIFNNKAKIRSPRYF